MAAKRSRATRCKCCNHAQRPAIDLAIACGVSKRLIAERHKISFQAVFRHAAAHLTPEVRAALATKIFQREGDMRRVLLEEGTSIVEALKAIRGPLFGLYLAAVDVGDGKAAANLAGRLHESLSLSAKVTGELTPHAAVSITNVLLSPDFMRLRAELLRVLARYPEARAEVAAVFRNAGERAAAEMRVGEPRLIEASQHAA
jgi:hypothetical protein